MDETSANLYARRLLCPRMRARDAAAKNCSHSRLDARVGVLVAARRHRAETRNLPALLRLHILLIGLRGVLSNAARYMAGPTGRPEHRRNG
jgi:hypothetical protein